MRRLRKKRPALLPFRAKRGISPSFFWPGPKRDSSLRSEWQNRDFFRSPCGLLCILVNSFQADDFEFLDPRRRLHRDFVANVLPQESFSDGGCG